MFWRLLTSEFKKPDANLVLSVAVVACGMACVIASFATLSLYDSSTKQLVAANFADSTAAAAPRNEKRRRINAAKRSFNALILPMETKPLKVKTASAPKHTIIDSFLLAVAGNDEPFLVVPVIERSVRWREENCRVIICGLGEKEAGNDGDGGKNVVMGAALADALSFSVNDDFLFNGEPMRVTAIRPEKGDLGDITIWTTLKRTQSLLGIKHRISGVFALGCADMESLANFARRVFPNPRILRFYMVGEHNTTMANTRKNVSYQKRCALLKQRREKSIALEKKLAGFGSLAALIFAASLFLLTVSRVERKKTENAILSAFGLSERVVFSLEMSRGCIIFSIATALAFPLAYAILSVLALIIEGISFQFAELPLLFDPKVEIWIVFLTAAVVITTTCAAALKAAVFDPMTLTSR